MDRSTTSKMSPSLSKSEVFRTASILWTYGTFVLTRTAYSTKGSWPVSS